MLYPLAASGLGLAGSYLIGKRPGVGIHLEAHGRNPGLLHMPRGLLMLLKILTTFFTSEMGLRSVTEQACTKLKGGSEQE
jgi:hypothetical protein